MKIGLHIRNSGRFATRDMIRRCAQIADANTAIDDLWVYDHIAIPPDEAAGSEGYYLDPLATLAFLAAVTERVKIGTRVLILPYRAALPTAKWIASIQQLSGGRLQLGAGVGWMEAEFRALGVDRSRRGSITDETLAFIKGCFDAKEDEVTANGQKFLFRPNPKSHLFMWAARPPTRCGAPSNTATAGPCRRASRTICAHPSPSCVGCSKTPRSPSLKFWCS